MDRNGNGDLTEPGERVSAVVHKRQVIVTFGKGSYDETLLEFDVGVVGGPGGKEKHRGSRSGSRGIGARSAPAPFRSTSFMMHYLVSQNTHIVNASVLRLALVPFLKDHRRRDFVGLLQTRD